MEENKKLSATVFGATGLVGSKLVEQLSENESYSKVYVANRRKQDYHSINLKEVIVDFDKLEDYPELFSVDHIFIALGTTINKAGSKEKFKAVDLELPLRIAKLAQSNVLLMISSIGADKSASNFYLKTKGEAEEKVNQAFSGKAYFLRPSMLLGERSETRIGEAIGKFFIKNLEFLMLGSLKKYRGIYDHTVAKAMIKIASQLPEQKVLESETLKNIADK